MVKIDKNNGSVIINKWAALATLLVVIAQTIVIFYGAFVIFYTVDENQKISRNNLARIASLEKLEYTLSSQDSRICSVEKYITENKPIIANIPVVFSKLDNIDGSVKELSTQFKSMESKLWDMMKEPHSGSRTSSGNK